MKKYIALFVLVAVVIIGVPKVRAQEKMPVGVSQSDKASDKAFSVDIKSSTVKKDEVKKLQGFLINQGLLTIDGAPTGNFGPKTKQAIKDLQERLDVNPTGTLGPITRGKLNDILIAPEKSPDATVLIPKDVTTSTVLPPSTDGTTGGTTGGAVTPPHTTTTPATPPIMQPEKIVVKPTEHVDIVVPNPYIPRVMFWQGKVNQHIDLAIGTWATDPDGMHSFAGAEVDHLTYCKMFYPSSVAVVPYMYETIDSWHDRGNVNNYTATLMSYRCVEDGKTVASVDTTKDSTVTIATGKYAPRVMFWQGKVNQHIDLSTGAWTTDPDGLQSFAGAQVDHLTYCKMFYPNTVSLSPYAYEKIDSWHDRGNVSNYTATLMSYRCVQSGEDVTAHGSVLGAFTSANAATKTNFKSYLIVGSKGDEVTKLQQLLKSKGYLQTDASGYFGKDTQAALKKFQKDNGIEETGTCGQYTRAALNSLDKTNLTDSGTAKGTPVKGGGNGTDSLCNGSTQNITVVSPNGGEVFQQGQNITFQWRTCNVLASGTITADLAIKDAGGNYTTAGQIGLNLLNDGTEILTIPSNAVPGTRYAIHVNIDGVLNSDYSDNLFTITQSTSTTSPILSVARNSSFHDQTINNGNDVQIGSYIVTNLSATDTIKLTNIQIGLTPAGGITYQNFHNLYYRGLGLNNGSVVMNPGIVNSFPALASNTIIPPGGYTTVDIYSNVTATGGTVQSDLWFTALDGTTTICSPAMSGTASGCTGYPQYGQTMTIGTTLPIIKNTAYPNQNIAPLSTHIKIGSYTISNNNAEGMRIDGLQITLYPTTITMSDISNLSLYVNGSQVGPTIASPLQVINAVTNFTVAPNATASVELYADFGSAPVGSLAARVKEAGTGIISGHVTVPSFADGQTITIGNGGTVGSLIVTNLATPVATSIIPTTLGVELANLELNANTSAEDVKINSITITDTLGGPAAYTDIANLVIKNAAGTVLSTAMINANHVTFTFTSPIIIPLSSTAVIKLYADVVGGANGGTHKFAAVSSADVVVVGVNSGATIVPTMYGSGQTMMIRTNGMLSVSNVAGNGGTPATAQVVPVSTVDGMYLSYKWNALYESQKIRKITLKATGTQLRSGDISNLRLYAQQGVGPLLGTTMPFATASQFGTCVANICQFTWLAVDNLLPFTINPGVPVTIFIKADITPAGIAYLGDNFYMSVTNNGTDVTGFGVSSGLAPTYDNSTVNAGGAPSQIVPFRVPVIGDYPTNGSTILSSVSAGTVIGRFKVTNNGTALIALKPNIKFTDSGSHTGTTARYTMYSSDENMANYTANNLGVSTTDFSSGTLTMPIVQNISAGAYRYITIAITNVTGLVSGDTFNLSLANFGDMNFVLQESQWGHDGNQDGDTLDTSSGLWADGRPSLGFIQKQ